MHPILFRIPLPAWTIPLFPALLGVAVLGALIALFGYTRKAVDLLAIGGALALGCAVAAFKFRGQTYTLGALPIYSYGAMLCLSLVVGWYLTLGLAQKDGLPRETMANCYFITAVGALIFARLLYVATNLEEFHSFADLLNIRRGGMVAYGGFLGGFLASYLFLRAHRIRLLPWADVAVPSLASGLAITRIGCYLFGCDFGKPLSDTAPGWLKKLGTFPHWADGTIPDGSGSPAWIQHVNHRGLSPDAVASLPVHPTQLYESLVGVGLLALVFMVRRKQKFRGEVFYAFTFGYGVCRFLLEIIRDDIERGEYGPYLAEHLFIPLALLGFAAAYNFGPARSIANATLRRVTQALSLVPAVIAYIAMKPGQFAPETMIQLSTSQWIGLASAVAVAFAWTWSARAADLDPEGAMSLGLDGAVAGDDEAEAPAAAEKETPAPKKRKRRKKKPAPAPAAAEAADDEASADEPKPDDESGSEPEPDAEPGPDEEPEPA